MKNQNIFARIFGVFIDPRTYGGILYQLLALPLGIVYFTLLVTGFSLGIPLILIWVGIPILLLVMVMAWGLTAFERVSAIGMQHQADLSGHCGPSDTALAITASNCGHHSTPRVPQTKYSTFPLGPGSGLATTSRTPNPSSCMARATSATADARR